MDAAFEAAVPVFPLPGVVLFPRTVLPLHIFEPRYREMTRDALEGGRLIAMALLKPGWEPGYEGRPPIHDVVGLGRILQDRRLEDGRYHILLAGLCRARIEEELAGKPYRLARLRPIVEPAADETPERVRLGLLAVYGALLKSGPAKGARIEPNLPLGAICDLIAACLDAAPTDKQAVLEEADPGRRARLVVDLVRRSPSSSIPVSSGLFEAGKGWPPTPSLN